MSKPTGKRTFADRIRQAWMAKDAEAAEKLAKEAEDAEGEETAEEREEREAKESKDAAARDKKTGDALAKIFDKLKSMDEDMKELKEKVEAKDDDGDDGDDGDETGDESEGSEKLDAAGVKLYTGDAGKRVLALAEILSPGIKLPTFDAKTTDAARANSLCKCQRRALDKAYQTEAGRAAISPFLGGHKANFAKLAPAMVNAAFTGAAHLIRTQNNDASNTAPSRTTDFGKPVTAASLNAQNKEFWANRSKH